MAVRLELVRGCHDPLDPGVGGCGVCGFLPVPRVTQPRPTLPVPWRAPASARGNAVAELAGSPTRVPVSGGPVRSQSWAAILIGSMPNFFHQRDSLRERWSSR